MYKILVIASFLMSTVTFPMAQNVVKPSMALVVTTAEKVLTVSSQLLAAGAYCFWNIKTAWAQKTKAEQEIAALAKIEQSERLDGESLPDASAEYRGYFDDALRAYGVRNPSQVPLKSDPRFDDVGITTTFGVIINEDELRQRSVARRMRVCWHEAAHWVLDHYDYGFRKKKSLLKLQRYLAIGSIFLAPAAPFLGIKSKRCGVGTALASMSCLGINTLIGKKIETIKNKAAQRTIQDDRLDWLERSCEKEADAFTIKHMIKTGRNAIVEAVRKEYQQEEDPIRTVRWDTLRDQAIAELQAEAVVW